MAGRTLLQRWQNSIVQMNTNYYQKKNMPFVTSRRARDSTLLWTLMGIVVDRVQLSLHGSSWSSLVSSTFFFFLRLVCCTLPTPPAHKKNTHTQTKNNCAAYGEICAKVSYFWKNVTYLIRPRGTASIVVVCGLLSEHLLLMLIISAGQHLERRYCYEVIPLIN